MCSIFMPIFGFHALELLFVQILKLNILNQNKGLIPQSQKGTTSKSLPKLSSKQIDKIKYRNIHSLSKIIQCYLGVASKLQCKNEAKYKFTVITRKHTKFTLTFRKLHVTTLNLLEKNEAKYKFTLI